jgi:hypothetical protein
MQLGNFIDIFLTRHVSDTYAHHQEHYMLSCSVGRVYGADGAVHGTIRTAHTTYTAALKATTHPNIGAENHMLQLNI